LAITPKFTAGLSVLCSSIVVWLVLTDPRRRCQAYHRLLLGMCLTDALTSFWWVMSTWPIPKGDALWAVGNTNTCTCQGFFLQVGIANPLYNLSLSVYFLLAVHLSWGEAMLRKYEFLFHLGPLGWGFTTAIIGLPLKIFNNATLWCWINDLPGRNENTAPYRWGFFYAPLWLAAVLVSYNLARLVSYFRKLTLTTEKHVKSKPAVSVDEESEFGGTALQICIQCPVVSDAVEEEISANSRTSENGQPDHDKHASTFNMSCPEPTAEEYKITEFQTANFSAPTQGIESLPSKTSNGISRFALRRRQLAFQCLRYALVFYATWFPITLLRIYQAVGKDIEFRLLYAAAFLTPLQGLPNFLVYLYPIFAEKLRERYSDQQQKRNAFGANETEARVSLAHQQQRSVCIPSHGTPYHFDLDLLGEDEEVFSRRIVEQPSDRKMSFVRMLIGIVETRTLPHISSLFKSQSDLHSDVHGQDGRPANTERDHNYTANDPAGTQTTANAQQVNSFPPGLLKILEESENAIRQGQVKLWSDIPPSSLTSRRTPPTGSATTQTTQQRGNEAISRDDLKISDSMSPATYDLAEYKGLGDSMPIQPNRLASRLSSNSSAK